MLANEEIVQDSDGVLLKNDVDIAVYLDHKKIYRDIVREKKDSSKSEQIFKTEYDINDEEFEKIHMLPFQLKVNNKVKEMQYKIIHGYLATNYRLYKMKLIPSPRCNFCLLYNQDRKHLFFTCLEVQNIWLQLQNRLSEIIAKQVKLSEKEVLFGIYSNQKKSLSQFINKVILFTKYYIYISKVKESDMSFGQLTQFLENLELLSYVETP